MLPSLDDLSTKYGTDKGTVHDHPHGYTLHYELAFSHLREQQIRLLEIGVWKADSIQMWLDYFPLGQIVGMDIEANPEARKIESQRYEFWLGDQADQQGWGRFNEKYALGWDIIIDDGGHRSNQVIMAHNCLWPHLHAGGFYCIEDLNVSYPDLWAEHGGQMVPDGWTSHMDFIKSKLDLINRRDEIEWLRFSKQLAILKKK